MHRPWRRSLAVLRVGVMLKRSKWHKDVTDERIFALAEQRRTSLDDPGLCLGCGAEAHGVEPDARRCECESCGEPQVYGVEELLMEVAL